MKLLHMLRQALRGDRLTQAAVMMLIVLFLCSLLSPLLPNVCRFNPSCSVYALEALKLHGPLKGSWLTVRRLARCHPITWLGGSSGFDPVPHPPSS